MIMIMTKKKKKKSKATCAVEYEEEQTKHAVGTYYASRLSIWRKEKHTRTRKKSAKGGFAQRVASSTAIVLSLTASALPAPARLFFSTFSMNASPAL